MRQISQPAARAPATSRFVAGIASASSLGSTERLGDAERAFVIAAARPVLDLPTGGDARP